MSKLFIHKLSNVWFSIEHHNFKPKLFRWKNPMPIEFGGIFQPWPEAATEIVAKKEAAGILAARDERGRRGPAGPWRVSHGEAEMVLSGWILWFIVDITSYLMGIIMVYKPTFTSLGGPILYEYGKYMESCGHQIANICQDDMKFPQLQSLDIRPCGHKRGWKIHHLQVIFPLRPPRHKGFSSKPRLITRG